MDRELVSVVVPSYNHSRFIRSCLDSIVDQTYGPIEIVIVDDGSTDDSVEVIRSYVKEHEHRKDRTFQTFFRTNHGAHRSINFGIGKSRGRVVTILNSDDLFHPTRLEQLTKPIFSGRTECVMSLVEFIDQDSNPLLATNPRCAWYLPQIGMRWTVPSPSLSLFLQPLQVTSGNLVFTRRIFDRLGGFKNYMWAHDYDFALRSTLLTEPMIVSKKLMSYRYHGTNTVSSMERERSRFNQEVRRIVEDFLEEGSKEYRARTLENRFAATPYTWTQQFRDLLSTQALFFSEYPLREELSLCNDEVVGRFGSKAKVVEVCDRLWPFISKKDEAQKTLLAMTKITNLHVDNFRHVSDKKIRFTRPRIRKVLFESTEIGSLIEIEGKIEAPYDDKLLLAGVVSEGRMIAVLRFAKARGVTKAFRGFTTLRSEALESLDLRFCWLDFEGANYSCRWGGSKPVAFKPTKLRGKVPATGYIDGVHVGRNHVVVEGWAAIDGELPEKIQLKLGGRLTDLTPALRERTDLSTFFRDRLAHRFAGFRFTIPTLSRGEGEPTIEIVAQRGGKTLHIAKKTKLKSVQI